MKTTTEEFLLLKQLSHVKNSITAKLLPEGATDSLNAQAQRDALNATMSPVFFAAESIRFYGIDENLSTKGGILPDRFKEIFIPSRQAHNVTAENILSISDFVIDSGRIWQINNRSESIYVDYDCLLCFFLDVGKLPKSWWATAYNIYTYVNPLKGIVGRPKSEIRTFLSKNKNGCVVWIDFTYFNTNITLLFGDNAINNFWTDIGNIADT
jgi:hypothetical protein